MTEKFIRSINIDKALWKKVQAKMDQRNEKRSARESMSGLITKALTAYLELED